MIAIKRKNGTVIWLDAVLSFNEDYTSSVTKHKVGSGSTISDHVIEENAQFSIDGVVSGVEWSNGPTYGLSNINAVTDIGEVPQITLDSIEALQSVNLPANASHVSIVQGLQNPIIKLLPESLRQFVDQNTTPPEIVMGEASVGDNLEAIKSTLIQLNRGFPRTTEGRVILEKEEVAILRFDYDWTPLTPILNCICTGLQFSEDANTGDAIYPKMRFEQVRYAGIETAVVPEFVVKNMGKKQGVEASGEVPDPKTESVSMSRRSQGQPKGDSVLEGLGKGDMSNQYNVGKYDKIVKALID